MNRTATLLAASAASLAALWFSFLHLMQTSPWFAEQVAKVSPSTADAFSCSCPFCSSKVCLDLARVPDDNLTTLGKLLDNAKAQNHGF